MLRAALRSLQAGRRRTAVAALAIALAATMAGAAVTVAYGLHTGFERSADQADLPDVVARFKEQDPQRIADLVEALPNVAGYATRTEFGGARLRFEGHSTRRAALQFVDTAPGARRGYTVVAGRDLTSRSDDEVLVERGLANEWGIGVGDTMRVGRAGAVRVAGISVAPDNVAFPLASAPRVTLSRQAIERQADFRFRPNELLVWTADPSRTDITLQQARATAFGVDDLRFVTRDGVRVLIDQAAGIVIALLVSFSVIALGAAGMLLAAQAGAEVQRRLPTLGVLRAIGAGRGRVAGEQALAAGLLAVVAGLAGLALGALAVSAPSRSLLEALNEQPPGTAVLLPLAGALAAIVALAAAAAAWPGWRAAGRPPVTLLRGAELQPSGRRGTGLGGGGGFLGLGARLAMARRGRAVSTVVVLAVSGSVVLLMVGLANLVTALRDDPGSVGKRYDLTVRLPATSVPAVRALAGVDAAAPRYVVRGADSYALGEPVKLIGLPGDHTAFEDPPLADGRRLRTAGEAEIGTGLAAALGVRPGGTLAVQLPDGGEARFRVVGTVRALDDDGRIAYVRPDRLLAAATAAGAIAPDPEVVVRLKDGADPAQVTRELAGLGAVASKVGGATTRSGAFLDTLASVLRAIAIVDVLVCLYALVQALTLTAAERRQTLAVLRSAGATLRTIVAVLVGAALVLALPAALIAIALEHLVLSPLVGRLAAGYADLGAGAGTGPSLLLVLAFALVGALAAGVVARRVVREPPVRGLRAS